MQIWRMKARRFGQEQITSDDYNNWFAHPSPNGRWIVFLSYAKGVKGHPGNQDVLLRLMTLSDGKIRVLAKLSAGRGRSMFRRGRRTAGTWRSSATNWFIRSGTGFQPVESVQIFFK